MSKRKRLNLDELKVQSFVTELQSEHAYTAKGGDDQTTFDKDWLPCLTWIVSVYTNIAKEKSWFPYTCKKSNSSTGTPLTTFEFDSCM